MSCDALFLSPHPDDVELFCGGTVARLAKAGQDIVLGDLTRGELASNGSAESRRASSLRAVEVLGARTERPVLDLGDGALDGGSSQQVEAIVALIRRYRPRVLFAPWIEDRHPDHEAAGKLASRAHFLSGVARFAPGLGEAFRSDRFLYYPCHRDRPVDLCIDVSASMDLWAEAVDCYADQFERGEGAVETPINAPRFLLAQRGWRARLGSRIGVEFAEGFVHEEPWRVGPSELTAKEPGE